MHNYDRQILEQHSILIENFRLLQNERVYMQSTCQICCCFFKPSGIKSKTLSEL